MKTTYQAQWYEDDCITEYGFDPYALHTSQHDTMDEAKQAAFKNASRGDTIWVAYVHICKPWNEEDPDYYLKNEVYKNKWSGWEKVEITS